MRNNNGAVIRRLIGRSLQSNKKRNFFIIAAIMLTTFMITSVFSIGISLYESFAMQQIRLEGSKSHAAFPYPTPEQIARLRNLDYVESIGVGNYVGNIRNTPPNVALDMVYFDESLLNNFHVPAWTNIVGTYPEKENEIMASRWALEKMGIENPKIGMIVPFSYTVYGENIECSQNFVLSGYYTNYNTASSGNGDVLLVSKALSDKYDKSAEREGSVNIIFKDGIHVNKYIEMLKVDLGLSTNQTIVPSPVFDVSLSEHMTTILFLALVIMFFMLTGYLLIYNVLYISVSRDVRSYGLLKTLGTTPKQLRRIVVGQVARLCMVGIPVGILVASLVSLILVPVMVSRSDIETGAVISFSPFIYIGAAFLSLSTALIGAATPAKKAARISPVEATKYAGEMIVKKRVYGSVGGKPYRMAFRNIFRERKRTLVVLLSLFLGVTVFMAVSTLLSSIDLDKYAASEVESDFLLRNEALMVRAELDQKFNNAFMRQLESLPGNKEIQITTQERCVMKYQEAFEGHLVKVQDEFSRYGVSWTKDKFENNFTGFIYGIDKGALVELNKTLAAPIDLDAFERGKFALISSDEPELYEKIHDMEVTCYPNEKRFSIPLGGFVPYHFKQANHEVAPTIFVSNAFLRQFVSDPLIRSVNINVAKGYDEQIYKILKEILRDNNDISMNSKYEARQVMRDAKTILFILGGGISAVLGLIGILNFVNVMSVGILVRKREFATLESVGMSKRQLRRMLINEGMGYAVITLLLVLLAGNMITFGLFELLQSRWDVMTFSFPLVPIITAGLAIIAICIVTPEIVYRAINKTTIIERLREAE